MGIGIIESICKKSNSNLCGLVGNTQDVTYQLLYDECYPRSVDLANTIVFNIGNIFIQLGIMLVLSIMIYNSYGRYTAVGRREMLDLIYLFYFLNFWSMVVDSGVVPPNSGAFSWFVSVQNGLSSAMCLLLLWNGLVLFQFWEDGTRKSLAIMRLTCLFWGLAIFVICIFTFHTWDKHGVANFTNTTFLEATLYIVNMVLLFLYCCAGFHLTLFVIREWWAFGAQVLGLLFFVVGQVLMYAFSNTICNHVKHYVDGKFFATVCNGFAILLVYKAWDIITSEDLEFSVSPADNVWDLKSVDEPTTNFANESEYAMSHYTHQSPYM